MLLFDLMCQNSVVYLLQCLCKEPPAWWVWGGAHPHPHQPYPPLLCVSGKVCLDGIKFSLGKTKVDTKLVEVADYILKVQENRGKV